jgi:hypothetical protein
MSIGLAAEFNSQGGELMSVENENYLQSWSVLNKVYASRADVIHTFGGRGSPVSSRVSA